MRWLIDSDVLIEGERGNPDFNAWLATCEEVATADIVRAEFLLGVHLVLDQVKRGRGERFYSEKITRLASLPNETADYELAAKLAGEARRTGQGKPSLPDALLAAIAIRTGATVATRNLKDFQALGCDCKNPLANLPGQ